MAYAPPSNPFPPASEADWHAAALKALKGGDFERKLVTRSAGGLVIQPLYQRRRDAQHGCAVTLLDPTKRCRFSGVGAASAQEWSVACSAVGDACLRRFAERP